MLRVCSNSVHFIYAGTIQSAQDSKTQLRCNYKWISSLISRTKSDRAHFCEEIPCFILPAYIHRRFKKRRGFQHKLYSCNKTSAAHWKTPPYTSRTRDFFASCAAIFNTNTTLFTTWSRYLHVFASFTKSTRPQQSAKNIALSLKHGFITDIKTVKHLNSHTRGDLFDRVVTSCNLNVD